MNGNQTMPYGQQWLAATSARRQVRLAEGANSLTFAGIWLALTGASVVLSAFRMFRPEFAGLLVQPYLIPIGLAFPFVLLTRTAKFPAWPLVGWIIFAGMYAFASIGPQTPFMNPISEVLKVVSAIVVIFTVALLVRSRTDFIFGAAGLGVAMAALAFRGLEDETIGEKYLDVANRNSYSMYALPAVLLAFYIALRFDWRSVAFKRWWFWGPILACSGLASYAVLSGSNRSGYLGLAFIILELFIYALLNPRFKVIGRASAWILITAVAAGVIGILIWRQATEAFERRAEQTIEGNQSDRLRWDIMLTSLQIGWEKPVAGDTPQHLPYEIGRRIGAQYNDNVIDTHNVFAHLIGGCGFICTASLLATAAALWFWRPKLWPGTRLGAGFYDARNFLWMMLTLWAVRGLFSREILYNPGFCIGIGLAIGLCIVEAGASIEPISADSVGRSGRSLQRP